ncbi:prolyl oligopeptidase family serine peptidase [Domibacillus sp. A3M-37]|uniref:alpha/beta hydrolase family protein n=1 Tax=Domibacillus sp. A3M-37 TaxID=2962037 RepID=UPI0020B7944F|nr:prolyl oligopeptidase family serine peptidase [Domibacillus sp. A3M-37]MCP3762423.1 prolyl oligopeptidase family serine peptidase [Domibacillus sp. A3M-37]
MMTCTPYPSPNPHVRLYMVRYESAGLSVKGFLAEPADDERYDGLLYLRGGIKGVGMVRPARIAEFAAEGFIVFAPFYRGNRGGEGNEDFAGDDREDAFCAFDWLEQHPRVRSSCVHVFGFSRGGVMAILTAIHRPAASMVTWGGVSDMTLTYEERKDMRRMMKRVIGGTPQKVPEQYERRTPLRDARRIKAPVLIIHGRLDKNVSAEHAYRLEQAVPHAETMYFDEYDHYIPPAVNRQIVGHIAKWMKGDK